MSIIEKLFLVVGQIHLLRGEWKWEGEDSEELDKIFCYLSASGDKACTRPFLPQVAKPA